MYRQSADLNEHRQGSYSGKFAFNLAFYRQHCLGDCKGMSGDVLMSYMKIRSRLTRQIWTGFRKNDLINMDLNQAEDISPLGSSAICSKRPAMLY
jgi:hypothetical protein